MSNKFQIIKSLIKLLHMILSMYFVLRLIDLEPDKRLYAIELLNLSISGVFTISSIKELFLSNNSVDDIGDDIGDD